MSDNMIHLQYVGDVPAVQASELRVGDRTMWNFGRIEEIVSIVPSKSGKTLDMSVKAEDGKIYPRTLRASRLVARVA